MLLKKIFLQLIQRYTSIGGQAVIEGVMMRSPHAFVVAVRLEDGTVRVRKDQWFGLSQKFPFFKKPFLRGVLVVVESMMNGIVALNYSANLLMNEELKKEALKKGKTLEEFEKNQKNKEKIGLSTFLTMLVSFAFGMGLFVFVPHWLTILLGQDNVQSFNFHFIDGLIKSLIFVLYIYIIGLFPDVKRIFQYHGAEHKAIKTFEAEKDLTVENAKPFTTLHPRCGTTFVFFLIFISILFFSAIFPLVNFGAGLPFILKHFLAVFFKIFLMFPVAGFSYEILKYAGTHSNRLWCKVISIPGLMLQKLTTKNPDDQQLEVGLISLKMVLLLEEKYNLKDQGKKILSPEEITVNSIDDIEKTNSKLADFLES